MRRALAVAALLAAVGLPTAARAEPVFIGTTYSHRQSAYLEMDWKENYLEVLKMQFYSIRLGAYWDEIERIEGRFDFSVLDFQIAEARARGIPVVLTVGMKAPRWPEFFLPEWLESRVRVGRGGDVSRDPLVRERALRFVRTVVERYRGEDAVRWWQVENEAMDRSGPKYWWIGADFLRQEVDLVRRLDGGKRPIILTVATYPNTFLFFLARFRADPHPIFECLELCDILGINVYPVVGQLFWKFRMYFWSSPSEREEYFRKVLRLVRREGKTPWIMELQAEPWEPGQLVHKGGDRPPSGIPENVLRTFREFRELGYPVIFLWGVEYWHFRERAHGDRHWLDMVKDLLRGDVPKDERPTAAA